jgi:hypothetical protein
MKRITFALLVFMSFAFPIRALADVAPPYNPPGSSVEPGSETTQVRMVAETVLIDVRADVTPNSLGSARLTADFSMHNTGSAAENLAVRFPISSDDGRGGYPEITDLIVQVEGRQISFRRVSYPDVRYGSAEVPWAEFDINFPAGQDVNIEVAYNLKGSGYFPFTAFYYILHTGAGWKDTIGSADITLRLPYPASTQNVIFDTQIGWAETTPGGVIQGSEVKWHFENFEPETNGEVQDMEFALPAPAAWQAVINEQKKVAKNPKDGEAWGRLAKAYKEVFFLGKGYREDAGGKELYKSSVEAYEKCLALLPNDAQWHAGFADLLASRSYWDQFLGDTPNADTLHAFDEIRTALQLAPNDSKVLEIADEISLMFPDGMTKGGTGYEFPWLTQTPLPATPVAAAVETATPLPAATDTPQPTNTPQPVTIPATPAPASKPSSPICGSAALIPLLAVVSLRRKSKRQC